MDRLRKVFDNLNLNSQQVENMKIGGQFLML
ncbi:MAG: hypothetical protein CM1200mP12_16380 [Gammaproteobacteria bacterium]|nr:MAG: hypothetical protein CM1200mP12_16380 [Gammaproteobacteria bacterium]